MNELKRALEREAERFPLEPEGFEGLVKRRERRQRNQRVVTGVIALLLTAVGTFGAIRAFDGGKSRPAGLPSDRAAYKRIAGKYALSLSEADRRVRELGLAGRYTMQLRPNGMLALSAPAGFPEGSAPSAITYRLNQDQFMTNAFVNVSCPGTVGLYRWRLVGNELVFEPVREPCVLRHLLFASGPWQRQTSGP